mmetsp:Transcript_68436/g.178170  ORF Transcript_68436/g.178170 Transcript_68436/m.178170 type:complete len:330 (+) Transcript_68436:399-1388(+)
MGPSSTSTTSSSSRRRTVLLSLSLMLIPEEIAVSEATFISLRTMTPSLSLLRDPSSSSSSCLNTLFNASSDGGSFLGGVVPSSFLASSFLQAVKNLMKSASLTDPSLSASNCSNICSFDNFSSCWWYLIMPIACTSRASSSSRSLFFALSRKVLQLLVALARRGSHPTVFACSLFTSTSSHVLRASSTSSLSPSSADVASAMSAFASLIAASTSSDSWSMSVDESSFALAGSGRVAFSAVATRPSDLVITCSTPFAFSCSSAFISASIFSFSSLSFRSMSSSTFSRAQPMAILSRKSCSASFAIPFGSSDNAAKISSRGPSWILNCKTA